MVNAQQRLS